MSTSPRTPIVGGNWKMNTNAASAKALAAQVAAGCADVLDRVQVAIFPPFPYLATVAGVLRDALSRVLLGAQDFFPEKNGAFTGEVSLEMLADCGVKVVLVGHSERRHVIRESDDLIAAKARASLASGMRCILCVGETIEQRRAGQTDSVNERQLRSALANLEAHQLEGLVIAYEPVWAIGTGMNATPDDARSAHAHIRNVLSSMFGPGVAEHTPIQYGGSVKPANAREIFSQPGVDGGLIGGASLKADDFCPIVRAAVPDPS
jgi:triosephosphate isomerase (TIM)